MADLTLLSSPPPMPPHPSLTRPATSLYNARASSSRLQLGQALYRNSRPQLARIHVDRKGKQKVEPVEESDSDDEGTWRTSTSSGDSKDGQTCDSPQAEIISPKPIIAGISTPNGTPSRSRHRPSRSQSAPPERTTFSPDQDSDTPRSQTYSETVYAGSAGPSAQFSPSLRPKRGSTYNSPASFNSTATNGLPKPPPPLHRPTTFWRRTPRSGVTSSSYSPSTHLIRRATFIAAGLPFDKPVYDVSALAVESRIVHDAISGKVTEAFWEVIEAR